MCVRVKSEHYGLKVMAGIRLPPAGEMKEGLRLNICSQLLSVPVHYLTFLPLTAVNLYFPVTKHWHTQGEHSEGDAAEFHHS